MTKSALITHHQHLTQHASSRLFNIAKRAAQACLQDYAARGAQLEAEGNLVQTTDA